MAWVYLLVAGVFEVAFTTAFRFIDGFTRPWPTLLFVIFASLSFIFLQKATTSIPLGMAYAVWTGIGAAGTVIVGLLFFGEPARAMQLLFLVLLIGSIIGLKLVSGH